MIECLLCGVATGQRASMLLWMQWICANSHPTYNLNRISFSQRNVQNATRNRNAIWTRRVSGVKRKRTQDDGIEKAHRNNCTHSTASWHTAHTTHILCDPKSRAIAKMVICAVWQPWAMSIGCQQRACVCVVWALLQTTSMTQRAHPQPLSVSELNSKHTQFCHSYFPSANTQPHCVIF